MLDWIKWKNNMSDEAIWVLVAKKSSTRLSEVVLTVMSIYEFIAQNEVNGSIYGFCEAANDAKWDFDEGTTSRIFEQLRFLGLIVDDIFIRWEREQIQADSAKKAAYRARKKAESELQ